MREESREGERNSAESELNSESRVALILESGASRSLWSRGISVDDAEEESRCCLVRAALRYRGVFGSKNSTSAGRRRRRRH